MDSTSRGGYLYQGWKGSEREFFGPIPFLNYSGISRMYKGYLAFQAFANEIYNRSYNK